MIASAVSASRRGPGVGVGTARVGRRQVCDRRPRRTLLTGSERPGWWIAADESALPAVATLLSALPASATAEVHLEVDGAEDEIALESAADISVNWHHRRNAGALGAELDAAAAEATIASGTQVWVACEAAAVRRIRRLMLEQKNVPESNLVTRGYWRLGEADHPDHDYGED